MNDFDKLIHKALNDIQGDKPNPYTEVAEQVALMHNAFINVGFSHNEAYELASNILLEQLSKTLEKM